MQSSSGIKLLDAPLSTHDVFTSLSLSKCCCLHSEEISFGPCWRRDILTFEGQRSSTSHKMLLFVSWRHQYAIIEWPLFDASTSSRSVFTSFS